jgi:hypothetical protein
VGSSRPAGHRLVRWFVGEGPTRKLEIQSYRILRRRASSRRSPSRQASAPADGLCPRSRSSLSDPRCQISNRWKAAPPPIQTLYEHMQLASSAIDCRSDPFGSCSRGARSSRT